MPTIPYKAEKQNEEEDYEIVSFEDFCDKSSTAKADLLTLNDNINYRLCYENGKDNKLSECGEGSGTNEILSETSLNGSKASKSNKRKILFAPFGKSDKSRRSSLFSNVIPKVRSDDSMREHRWVIYTYNNYCI